MFSKMKGSTTRSLSMFLSGLPLLALCLVSTPQSLIAASFNCSKAATEVEYLICGSHRLSALDSEMAKLYRALRSRNDSIRQGQRDWLRRERNTCESHDCLLGKYNERIAFFQALQYSQEGDVAPEVAAAIDHPVVREQPRTDDNESYDSEDERLFRLLRHYPHAVSSAFGQCGSVQALGAVGNTVYCNGEPITTVAEVREFIVSHNSSDESISTMEKQQFQIILDDLLRELTFATSQPGGVVIAPQFGEVLFSMVATTVN